MERKKWKELVKLIKGQITKVFWFNFLYVLYSPSQVFFSGLLLIENFVNLMYDDRGKDLYF